MVLLQRTRVQFPGPISGASQLLIVLGDLMLAGLCRQLHAHGAHKLMQAHTYTYSKKNE